MDQRVGTVTHRHALRLRSAPRRARGAVIRARMRPSPVLMHRDRSGVHGVGDRAHALIVSRGGAVSSGELRHHCALGSNWLSGTVDRGAHRAAAPRYGTAPIATPSLLAAAGNAPSAA